MSAGQFTQGHGDCVGNERSGEVAENYAGASDLECGGRAQKESRPDGTADGDHSHLAGGQLVVKTLFVDGFRGRDWGHGAR